MTTTQGRVTSRWTKGWRKVAAVLGVGGIVMGTLLLGSVATAPAATACPSWCLMYQKTLPGGSGQYCSVTGETVTLRWSGASSDIVEYPKPGATGICQYPSESAAKTFADQQAADRVAHNKADATSGYTEGACVPKYRCEPLTDSDGGSADFCDATTGQTIAMPWSSGTQQVTYQLLDPSGSVTPGCDYTTKEAAESALETMVSDATEAARLAAFADAEEDGYLEGACPTPEYKCVPVTVSLTGSGPYCSATGVDETLKWSGSGTEFYHVVVQGYPQSFECPLTQEEATELATTEAEEALEADRLDVTKGATPGTCVVPASWVGDITTSGSAEFCTVEGTTVSIAYSGSGHGTSAVSQADADYQAALIAQQNANADLLSKTPTGAVPGACPVTPTPEPEVVAPVLPGTVEEPETVAVPAPATVPVPAAAPLPATVPAGDGSEAPAVPAAALAVLVLGATALAVTAVRLVRTTR